MYTEKQKKQLGFWLGMFVTFVCLGSLFFFIDPAQIWIALTLSRPGYVVLTAVLIGIYMIFRAFRWQYLLEKRVNLITVFHVQNIGAMLTQLLPFRIGDVTKAVLIGQKPETTMAQALSTVVVERVLDMLVVVLLFPLVVVQLEAVPLWFEKGALLSAWLVGLAMIGMILAVRFKRQTLTLVGVLLSRASTKNRTFLVQRIEDLIDGLSVFSRVSSALKVLMLSFLTWTPVFMAYHTIMTAVHIENHTVSMAIFIACAGALSVAAPSSPGQIGVFHIGVTAAVTVFGESGETAAALAFLYHATNFGVMVLLGVLGAVAVNVNLRSIFSKDSLPLPASIQSPVKGANAHILRRY